MTGYCIGGLHAVRTASLRPDRVAALAAFHAPVAAAGAEVFASLECGIVFGHAEGDITPDALGDVNRSLDAAGLTYVSEIYPGTTHGFTMSDTAAFNPAGL